MCSPCIVDAGKAPKQKRAGEGRGFILKGFLEEWRYCGGEMCLF